MSPRLRFDLVLNNLTAWAYTTGKVHLKSDGSAWRPIVHIEDISRAFIAVLKADRDIVHNEAFNIGAPSENYRVREIAEMVRDVVPNSELRFAEGASADTRNYRVNFDKAVEKLKHFRPQWTARKGSGGVLRRLPEVRGHLEGVRGRQVPATGAHQDAPGRRA